MDKTMFREKRARFVTDHRMVLLPLLLLALGMIIANFFVDKHTAYLTGEQVFSFDYFGHLRNIVHDFTADPSTLLQTNDCLDCPDFYHYSKWYSLINLSVFSIGEAFRIHPFLFYVFLTIAVQLIAVYISFRLLFEEVQWFAFLVASVVFIILPVNFTYLGSGLYSFHHAFLLLSLSLVVRVLRSIDESSYKTIFRWGLVTGLASSVFLNVSIGFVPIFLYSFLGVLIFFYRKWMHSWKKIVCFSTTIFSVMAVLNAPIVLSALLHGNSRESFDYGKVNLLDSLTAGVTMVPPHLLSLLPIFVLSFFLAIIVLSIESDLNKKQSIIFASLYFFVAILLSGDIVFDFAFRYFPLMKSLRAVHRLIVFEEIVLLFIIYTGIAALLRSAYFGRRCLVILLSFILIAVPSIFIINNWKYLNEMSVPDEYFQVDAYLAQNQDEKIYFPAYLPIGQGINDNYTWSKNDSLQPTLYQNPFSSLFSIPKTITFERYPFVNQNTMDMRALFDYSNNPDKILGAMRDFGTRYLILDRNFLWQKNFPTFDYSKITSQLMLVRSFGNIDIYQLKEATKKCKKAYGEYAYGYCHVEPGERPNYLLNMSKEEYLITSYQPQKDDLLSLLRSDVINVYHGIPSPLLEVFLTEKKVAYADVMTMETHYSDKLLGATEAYLFQKEIGAGQYQLVVPILKVTKDQSFFKESVLRVFVNNKRVTTLNPQGEKNELTYEVIPLDLSKESVVSVRIEGDGYLVLKNPYILEQEKFDSVTKDGEWQPKMITIP